MILNGKCKEDFEKWYNGNFLDYHFYDSLDWEELIVTLQHALIIDFFDSVGINIYAKPRFHFGGLSFDGIIDGMEISKIETEYFKSRQQATEKAIEKANEIYNALNI